MSVLDTTPTPTITITEGTAPAAPASGNQLLFIDSASHHLKRENSSGTVVDLETAGSALVAGKVTRTAGDITTTSTSFVDATSLTLTLTTGAHRCLVVFNALATTNNAGASAAFDVTIDGSRVGQAYGLTLIKGVSAGNVSFSFVTDALTAAAHTFKIQWRCDTGDTATLYASAGVTPAILSVVELSV